MLRITSREPRAAHGPPTHDPARSPPGPRPTRKAPMRRRIALVTLVVDDYDEAIRFYTEALG
ncbi:VOC family protein, partial [Streptomyces scabiei]|uniref:VOC family protein n=1 Tax=Streptomyces scabiei TaxID=1930 RepID=UPI0029A3A723|nr:hypothetical protein [Streptomyces scabiei]